MMKRKNMFFFIIEFRGCFFSKPDIFLYKLETGGGGGRAVENPLVLL
jgi:hypothetical protein